MKAKWFYPFLPFMMTIGVYSVFGIRHGAWPPIEERVLHVIATLLVAAIMLGIFQPWRSDDERQVS